jgi:hypothetical protein
MAKKSVHPVAPSTELPAITAEPANKTWRPLIFISHDHRDASLAEAFANLLTDASGGFLKSFRSSDRKGGAGIEFGAEWYSEIMVKISDATDVVALLTPNSVNRPWILYEAGVAKGKLDKPVFGVVVGVAFDQATKGPFAQFQNSADDEDSLTKLVLQLIHRNSDAEPREEAVRREVSVFREIVTKLISFRVEEAPAKPGDAEASDAAKLFEEIKVMFRDLPERLNGQLSEALAPRGRRNRRFHPRMAMELMRRVDTFGDPALWWLMVISAFRDDAPWLFELGMEVHGAFKSGDPRRILEALERFDHSLVMLRQTEMRHYLINSPDMEMLIHELSGAAHSFLMRESPARKIFIRQAHAPKIAGKSNNEDAKKE